MKKINNPQLELFSKTEVDADTSGRTDQKNPFLDYIWGHEKTILLIIGFIVMGIVSFSLGVEKGKRLAALKADSHFDLAVKTQPSTSQSVSTNEGGKEPRELTQSTIKKDNIKEGAVKQPEPKESSQAYTIQVASYQTKTLAKKEAEILKKNGFLPLILSKGKYTILCIGNFTNKEMAKSSLSKFKKRYQDCFIRRL